VGDAAFAGESIGTAAELPNAQVGPLEPTSTEAGLTPVAPTSKVTMSEEHSVNDGNHMKSTLVPIDALQWYSKGKERLR